MSAPLSGTSQRPYYSINILALLALYAVVPLALVLMLADKFWWQSWLLKSLPSQPDKWWLWALVFNWPHILASFITFADRDYWPQYKTRFLSVLGAFAALVIGIYALLPLYSEDLAFRATMVLLVFYMAYTVHHVLSQQLGLCRGFLRLNRPWLFSAWRFSNIAAGIAIYLLVFGDSWINTINVFGLGLRQLAVDSMRGFSLVAVCLGLYLLFASVKNPHTSSKAVWYLMANIAMMLVVWLALEWSYSLVVIAIPRLVHDISAFIIYACHDANRNKVEKHNYLYKGLAFLPLSPWIVCPLFAVVFANSLEALIPWVVQANFILAMTHYYLEARIWKQGQVHRQQLAFS